jgi:hypothetical protein
MNVTATTTSEPVPHLARTAWIAAVCAVAVDVIEDPLMQRFGQQEPPLRRLGPH